MNDKIKEVAFIDEKLKESYEKLNENNFQDHKLYEFISRAINDLKDKPDCGIRVPNRLIPREYSQKYEITNLWKYNLPNAWRLLYTITGNGIKIVSVLLDWMTHKEYERLFGY
ncbi:MAG: hypothetical protein Q8N88_02900 [Nanoarchaeota archaeon]|nr:hypothetical protein [Nanoarchaeota archaeon]